MMCCTCSSKQIMFMVLGKQIVTTCGWGKTQICRNPQRMVKHLSLPPYPLYVHPPTLNTLRVAGGKCSSSRRRRSDLHPEVCLWAGRTGGWPGSGLWPRWTTGRRLSLGIELQPQGCLGTECLFLSRPQDRRSWSRPELFCGCGSDPPPAHTEKGAQYQTK